MKKGSRKFTTATRPFFFFHNTRHRLKDVIYHRRGQGQGGQAQQGQEGDPAVGVSEQEERHLAMLDRGFLPSTQLFAVCFAYFVLGCVCVCV